MLCRRLRTGVDGLACARTQLGDARDSGFVVESAVPEEAADDSRGAVLAAPAVEVNDSAGGYFASDASNDLAVAVLVDHTHVRNLMSEVVEVTYGLRSNCAAAGRSRRKFATAFPRRGIIQDNVMTAHTAALLAIACRQSG